MSSKRYLFALLLAAGWSAIGPAKPAAKPGVDEIISLTRNTTATYAAYSVTHLYDPVVSNDQTAEFHSGHLHRVETPLDRVIANCETGEGYHFRIPEGVTRSDPSVAKSACGIDANRTLLSKQITATRSGKFGVTWRLIVTDPYYIRGYDVTDKGVIVAAFVRNNDEEKTLLLQAQAYRVTPTLPDKDMFSRESLNRSFLPR